MLKNSFYTVHDLQSAPDSLTCQLSFNEQHPIFDGHFPQQPVVPGVCMIQIVKELLQEQLQQEVLLRQTGQVKFLQLITPDVRPQVTISWKPSTEGYIVNANFKKDTDLFKLSATMELC